MSERVGKRSKRVRLHNTFVSDQLQEAFAKGLLKPGLNVPQLEPTKAVNNVVRSVSNFNLCVDAEIFDT